MAFSDHEKHPAAALVSRVIPGGWLIASLLLFRIIFLLFGDGLINGDGTLYVKAAQQIIATGALPPARFQSLGFAVLLVPIIALLGPKAVTFNYDPKQLYYGDAVANAVHVIHVLMDTAVVLILLYEGQKLLARTRGLRWTIWALAFIALQPFTAAMSTYVYPDDACMFFFFVGGWLIYRGLWAERWLWQLAAGSLLLGLAALARVDMVPVCGAFLAAACVLFLRSSAAVGRTRAIAVCAVMFLLPLAGMTMFQYRSTGEIGYVRMDTTQNAAAIRKGYFGWLRTWLILVNESLEFNGGDNPDWHGFDIDAYPSRAFKNDAQRAEVADALSAWRQSGYTPTVDKTFEEIAVSNRHKRAISTFLLVPAARMIHYWINLEGARAILVTLRLEPPWSRVATAAVFPFRILFVVLAAIGLYFACIRRRAHLLDDGDGLGFARICALMVILRTGELGILGVYLAAGLMETRYVIVALPAALLLAVLGWRECGSWREARPRHSSREAPSAPIQ